MAALPVSREQYLADMTVLKEQISTITGAGNVDEAMKRGILAQETVAKLAERLIMSMASVEDKTATMETAATHALATIERTAAQATPVERKRKSLAESKCIGNMKTLGSDKAEFKIWNEKFINAIAQVLGTPWRMYMRN